MHILLFDYIFHIVIQIMDINVTETMRTFTKDFIKYYHRKRNVVNLGQDIRQSVLSRDKLQQNSQSRKFIGYETLVGEQLSPVAMHNHPWRSRQH